MVCCTLALREAGVADTGSALDCGDAERRAGADAHLARMRDVHKHAMDRVAAGRGGRAYGAAADFYLADAEVLALRARGDTKAAQEALKRSADAARRAYEAELSDMTEGRIQVGTVLLSALQWSHLWQESQAASEPTQTERVAVAEAYLQRVVKLEQLATRHVVQEGDDFVGAVQLKQLEFFKADAEAVRAALKHDAKSVWTKAAEVRRDAAKAVYERYWEEFP